MASVRIDDLPVVASADNDDIIPASRSGSTISLTIEQIADLANNNLDLSPATTSADGIMSAADKTKLDGIATGATADSAMTNGDVTTGTATAAKLVSAAQMKLAAQTHAVSPIKAWANFNGTGTVAIRGSLNVSSITDNGAGVFTINFITPMPDKNYAVIVTGSNFSDATQGYVGTEGHSGVSYAVGKTTTGVRVSFTNTSGNVDPISANVAVLR